MYAKISVHSLAFALAILVVTFNVDVIDALKCYHCASRSDNTCGNPFVSAKAALRTCQEWVGYKSACITYTYNIDFHSKTVRTCGSAHIASGETPCGTWADCRECKTDRCNNFNYPS